MLCSLILSYLPCELGRTLSHLLFFRFYLFFIFNYILLIMLLQLYHSPPFNVLCPAQPFPPEFPPFSSCPWVIHISSLTSTFPILFSPSPCLFSIYHLCYLFSVPFPLLSPSHSPVDIFKGRALWLIETKHSFNKLTGIMAKTRFLKFC